MANELIPFGASGDDLPAHVTALFGEEGNILPRMTIDQLSYRGKVWRRIVAGEETTLTRETDEGTVPVQVVSLIVLDHNKGRSRAFYAGAYEEGKNASPDCFSGDGVTPDAAVKEPCAATCATCPNSVKGSKITDAGKQTTLCSPFKRTAVVPAGLVGSHPVMLLRLAQTSVWDKDNKDNEAKGWYAWDQYLDMLRARGAKHTAAVVTRVKFDTRMAYPKLLFSAAGWVSPEEAATAMGRISTDADAIKTILTGAGDSDGTMGHPAPATPAAKPAGEAGPTAEELAEKAAAVQAAKDAAAAKAAADKKAVDKAAKVKAAQDALAAAQAAAAAAAEDDDEGGDGGFGAATVTAPPAAAPAATKPKAAPKAAAVSKPAASAASTPVAAPAVVEGTPAGLADLLADWDK